MEAQQQETLQGATDGFAISRTLALREVLDGRPSHATSVLIEAIRGVLATLTEAAAVSSEKRRSKRRRLRPTSSSDDFGGMVQQLGRSPPQLIAQGAGLEFAHSEWRAAVELLLVSLACTRHAETAGDAFTVPQAEAVARYLDAFDAVDAADVEQAANFRRKYGGSAGLPDFAVAVVTIKRGGETVEAFRAAMPSVRCCLRAEPDFPLGLFLLGLCYDRIGAEPGRAARLFHAAFTSADALPRGLRPSPALLMAGVAHAHGHANSSPGGSESSWHAIQHFQDVLRYDAGESQGDQAPEINAALYNVAVLWASQSAGPSNVESTSHRDVMGLLVESFYASASSNAFAGPNTVSTNGSTVDSQVLLAPLRDIACLGQREVEHMAARAALRCADWTAASAAYAKLLGSWPEFELEQPAMSTPRERAGVACIDCIHREYCLALLRSAECSPGGAVKPTTNHHAAEDGDNSNSHDDATRKRCTAVALCEHVLKYRPNDVILLLLLSEAQYELGKFERALSAARVATQTLELLKSLELRHGHSQDKQKDASTCGVDDDVLATLAACGLDGCIPEQKSGLSFQLESLLAESYHQRAAVLWRLGRHDEAIDSHFLADRCLRVQSSEACRDVGEYAQPQPLSVSIAGVAELQDRVIFSLTLALWARGRCQEAAERWSTYRGWSSAPAAASDAQSDDTSAYGSQLVSQKEMALQGQLDNAGSADNSRRHQQRFIMDRLALGQLAH